MVEKTIRKGSSFFMEDVPAGEVFTPEDFSEEHLMLIKTIESFIENEVVPNIDPERSAVVGFSNGALTIAVLVSNHDEFVLSHFKAFCLVDHGMFHLTDLHRT